MTVAIGPEHRRAVHQESGLTVDWVRDEPAPERKSHFRLSVDGRGIPFEAVHDFGERALLAAEQDLSPAELSARLLQDLRKDYHAHNIAGAFDRQIFVTVWHALVSARAGDFKVSVACSEWSGADTGERRTWRDGD